MNIQSITPITRNYFFAYIALALYFYSYSRYGLNLWDEGGFAYGTWRTWNGQIAMKDFNPIGYLPGRYFFGTLMFKIFGVELQSLRMGMVLLTPFMVLGVFAIAIRLMPLRFSLLASAMILSAPSMYYNRFFPIFCVLNLFFLIRCLENPSRSSIILLISALIISLLFKPEVSIISILVSGIVLIPKLFIKKELKFTRKQLPWLIGFLLVGTWNLYYWIQNDVFSKLFNIVISTHQVWGNPFPSIFPFVDQLNKFGPHLMFEKILFYLPPLIYLLTFGVIVYRYWIKKNAHEIETGILISILGFGIGSFGLVIWRAGFDNLLRTLPAFYILVSYYLWKLWPKSSLTTLSTTMKKVSKIPFFYGIRIVLLLFPVLFLYEMNVHHGFYAGSIGAIIKQPATINTERIKVYTNPVEARWIDQILKKVYQFSNPGDSILALPLNPIFYFLSHRENSINHDWILPGMLNESQQKDVIKQIKNNPPKLVILSNLPIDGKESRRFSNYASVVHQFLINNYSIYEKIGLFDLYLPKNKKLSKPIT